MGLRRGCKNLIEIKIAGYLAKGLVRIENMPECFRRSLSLK